MSPAFPDNKGVDKAKGGLAGLRIKKTCEKLSQFSLDGIILSCPANISYLVNFTARDSYFLISKNARYYITDSRYTEEAKNNLKGLASLKEINGSVFKIIAGLCIALGLKRIGFEERYLSFAEHKKITGELNGKAGLIPVFGIIEESRQVKSQEEIERIKKGIQITREAFAFIKDFLSIGQKEIEVAAEIERFIRNKGARGSAFDLIVASGPNSSYPHYLTSERKVKKNEPILVDMGVDFLGYKSDLTRVFFLGKITPVVRRIYDIVRLAQDRAIGKIKPGVFIKSIDQAARQYIIQKGYGGFFGHNLGHGVGLEVHEEPHISRNAGGELKPGEIFTIEPGIYLPNKFGIRIEDMVLVTENGCEVLSGAINK